MERLLEADEQFSVWNNYEKCKEHRDSKYVTSNRRRSYLVSELNYYVTKWFSEKVLAIHMNKTELK